MEPVTGKDRVQSLVDTIWRLEKVGSGRELRRRISPTRQGAMRDKATGKSAEFIINPGCSAVPRAVIDIAKPQEKEERQ